MMQVKPLETLKNTKREVLNLPLTGKGKQRLVSSDGEKNHGPNPSEKDDIYQKSFHSISYRHM